MWSSGRRGLGRSLGFWRRCRGLRLRRRSSRFGRCCRRLRLRSRRWCWRGRRNARQIIEHRTERCHSRIGTGVRFMRRDLLCRIYRCVRSGRVAGRRGFFGERGEIQIVVFDRYGFRCWRSRRRLGSRAERFGRGRRYWAFTGNRRTCPGLGARIFLRRFVLLAKKRKCHVIRLSPGASPNLQTRHEHKSPLRGNSSVKKGIYHRTANRRNAVCRILFVSRTILFDRRSPKHLGQMYRDCRASV